MKSLQPEQVRSEKWDHNMRWGEEQGSDITSSLLKYTGINSKQKFVEDFPLPRTVLYDCEEVLFASESLVGPQAIPLHSASEPISFKALWGELFHDSIRQVMCSRDG